MSNDGAERLLQQVQRRLPLGDDVRAVRLVIVDVEQLFILDWEWAMRKNVDSILWESYKRLLDMKKETIDWCIGGLCELFVLVLHNEIKQTGPLPPVIIACQSLSTVQCAFAAFIYIRLGDLFRYKRQWQQSMSLYEHAIRLKPEDGRAWNQMAVLNLATGKLLPGLYYYARALSVPILFQPASANMNQLFSKLTSTPSSSTLTDHDRQHEPANMNQLFSKMTSSSSSSTLVEHDRLFVQLHALIHQMSLNEARKVSIDLVNCPLVGKGKEDGMWWFQLFLMSVFFIEALNDSKDEQMAASILFNVIIGHFTALVDHLIVEQEIHDDARDEIVQNRLHDQLPIVYLIVDWLSRTPRFVIDDEGRWNETVNRLLNQLVDVDEEEEIDLPFDWHIEQFAPFTRAGNNPTIKAVKIRLFELRKSHHPPRRRRVVALVGDRED